MAESKTMDVVSSVQSPPDTSGRPVLVSNRPMVQDSMVKAEGDTSAVAAKKIEPPSRSNKVIAPVADADKKPTQEQEQATESRAVEAVANQADVTLKKRDSQKNSEEKAKQELIKQLIASKKYFVPIGQGHSRQKQSHNLATVVLLFVVIAGLIGGYVAIDAGYVKTTIKLPINLIKN